MSGGSQFTQENEGHKQQPVYNCLYIICFKLYFHCEEHNCDYKRVEQCATGLQQG